MAPTLSEEGSDGIAVQLAAINLLRKLGILSKISLFSVERNAVPVLGIFSTLFAD